MIISSKIMISIFFNLQDQLLQMYVDKIRPWNSYGGKLKLIGMSSLFEINIIIFHLLTQEKPQLVVENNYTEKTNYSFQRR